MKLDEDAVDLIGGLKKLGFFSQDVVDLIHYSENMRRLAIIECNQELSNNQKNMDKRYNQACKDILNKYLVDKKITGFEFRGDPRGAMIIVYRDSQDTVGIRIQDK